MADGTTPAPEAQAPAPAPIASPPPVPPVAEAAPAPAPEGPSSEEIIRSVMGDSSPENFLKGFIESQGVIVDAPASSASPSPSAPVQPPVSGAPAPTNGQVPQTPTQPTAPAAPQGVDQQQLARLMSPSPLPPVLPAMPQMPQWPTAPVMPAAPTQAQVPQQQAQAPQGPPEPFSEPFPIDPRLAQALQADDPNIRNTAIGALVSAAGNRAFRAAVEYVQQQAAPGIASATMAQVEQQNFYRVRDERLYGPRPHLRYASPLLISQAAQIVAQDELARNPAATLTPEIWDKIGALADAGFRHVSAGQMPAVAPAAPAPAQPFPQQQGPQMAYHPQYGYVPVLPMAPSVPVNPASAAFFSGPSAGGFGLPPTASPTPASEVASFVTGGWGGQ